MLDERRKFFAELNFPVTKETDAWKEKVSYDLTKKNRCFCYHASAYVKL